MKQPQGFINNDKPHLVYKLCKAIYGLKQAPHAWYYELRQFLLLSGFTNSYADTSLFVLNNNGTILYLHVYVDDIIVTCSDARNVQTFIKLLSQCFIDNDKPHHVYKLCKAIYGLKQAPRAWYYELRQFLLSSGFTNSYADTSLFVLNNNGTILYLLVYVDDIIVTGSDAGAVQTFIKLLSQCFSLKNLDTLLYFLGVEVTPHSHGLFISQRKYILDLLTRAHMFEAKPATTPLVTCPPLTLHSGTSLSDPSKYITIVSTLQYPSLTRPNIAYTVNKHSQFMH